MENYKMPCAPGWDKPVKTVTSGNASVMATKSKPNLSPLEDKIDALADTVMVLLEEDRLTIGQGFDLLRRIERKLQDKAYIQKI